MADQQRILDGIGVIEIAEGIAAPVATMLLAAAGADVVKVEQPGGSSSRALPGFATWNRSKRSVVLDLDVADDRGRFDSLLAGADVLVHGFGSSDARRLGLDDGSLTARFPSLVVCGVPGYPTGHPDADVPASDPIVLARSGLMDEQAAVHRDGPVYLRMPLASWNAAYLASAGILARLFARADTGRGGAAHTSLLQGALVAMTMHWARATNPSPSFALGMPKDTSVSSLLKPTLFECGDGVWIHVMANPDATPLMEEVFADLGEKGVAEANAERGPAEPHRNFPNWGANVVAFGRDSSGRWLEELWSNDVPVQPAVPMGTMYFDEQAILNGYVVEVEDSVWGRVHQAGIPFTTTPASDVTRPAPGLGEHTDEVLGARRSLASPPGAPSPSLSASGGGPLAGLKVLDFGMFLAGPIAPMFLSDLGAEVIKVEAPSGDLMRFVERTFAGCQRGKRAIALDLKNPDARPVLEALVRWADIVHHNLRMPAARALGIDDETLRSINPRLVYCHVSSYGPVGPRADWPGFDQLFQAASGWEFEGAGEGNPPMWHRFGMMDHQGGLASLVAVLLGLHQRTRTGEGQFVTASLLGASVLTTSETLVRPDGTLAEYPRLDGDQLGVGPGRRIIRLVDGWIVVDASTPEQLDALCAVAGVTSSGAVSEAPASRRVDEVLAALEAGGVRSGPVRLDQMNAFFDDPATWQADLAARYPHAEYGTVEQVGCLWSFGDLQPRLDRASPMLGEHSAEVLADLGFDEAAIAALADSGAVVGRS